MILGVIDTALQQGLSYALASLGILISFRILNYPDLTVDGSFALGGAVLARLLVLGLPPGVAMVIASLCGFVAGLTTAFLNRKLGISKLLSGILVMLVLYSANLRIMGRANIPLLRMTTVLSPIERLGRANLLLIALFFVLAVSVKVLLDLFFKTRLGLAIRATGDNELMVLNLGVSTDSLVYVSMGLSNMLVAFAGSLISQHQGFADIGMGIGMIIIGLAAIIIGESFFRPKTIATLTLAAIWGTVIYFLIISISLRLGLAPTDLKLATALLVILGLSLKYRGKMGQNSAARKP